jgi:hypothetical protein
LIARTGRQGANGERPFSGAGEQYRGEKPMTDRSRVAEQMLRDLIADTNRVQSDAWRYELTSDVDNIAVESRPGTHTLRIHPCWLRYVVAQGDFKSCVADEIDAFYLLRHLSDWVTAAA